ncbi:hypothetical protein LTR37_002648 [Vermiconidia calcicola]|uniref:Uncharacterized protein n=1 Tax=Vermiconidia calcicola TaxID=1690605 RepID=A0ACC3NSB1_9PEZI|nr:hypothetical protein LTR37_002648 [Vermiconidia calcicola]
MQRALRTEQVNGATEGQTDGGPQEFELDAVVIGAGFAGVYLLHRLRQEGFNVKLVEAGSGLGGIWYWNNYPGARVDSQYPIYALAIPEVYNTWNWTEQYPGSAELQRYFQHIDNVLDISKDTIFNTRVSTATWDDSTHKWHLQCDNGTRITTRFMNACLGFAAKRHFPDWPGLQDFGGYVCHSSFWPVDGVDMKDKKMAVIGNGATGIQIAQTAAREAKELSVFVRTPNTCIPMKQGVVDPEQAKKDLELMGDKLGRERYLNHGGFLYTGQNKKLFDDPKEKRDRVLEDALNEGGFRILFQYDDFLTDEKVNRYVYDMWVERTRARMTDPVKKDILVPVEPLHPFAAKRPSLEQDYYEQMDREHVNIIDIKNNPVTHVEPKGIVTKDGTLHEVDIIAIATGFDSLTGGFMEIDWKGMNGEDLPKKWTTDRGALSYLGMTVHDFPNMFYTYGPHAPTAYANGPSIVQPQADWITDVCVKMREQGKTKIDATKDAEDQWKETVNTMHAMTLRHNVDSWYMGTNIPGKPKQALNYAGGIPLYLKTIREAFENDFEGFEVS